MKRGAFQPGMVFLALLLLHPAARVCAQPQPAETPAPTRESAATIIVYNNFDPSSAPLAAYYAKRRAIPLDHIVGLECPMSEEITRAQYDQMIADPLRKTFADRGWWHGPAIEGAPITENQIRFIALIRGIPLKIAAAPGYPGDNAVSHAKELNTNAAAVDSELATLGLRTRNITGPLRNPYYKSFTPFMDTPLAPIMLVCRLDGPTVKTVENMIDGGIAAEHNGLNGFAYIDLRGIKSGAFSEGDQWLATAAVGLREYGMPTVWDNSPDTYPEDFPMDHAAIYLGWYAPSVQGPMARDDFRFQPGAIAVHIHSFSGATVRDPSANWVGPLLAHGASATLGNVYEPYLDLTPHLDVFMDRLRNSFNFAESAYASVPGLSWMTTFVGDPLYRPFQEIVDPPDGDVKPAIEYEKYKEGAHDWYRKGRAAGEASLKESAQRLQSGIVWEGLGLLQWSIPDDKAALASFKQAEKCYGQTEDGCRTALHQVEILRSENKLFEAEGLAAHALREFAGFHGTALLKAVAEAPLPR